MSAHGFPHALALTTAMLALASPNAAAAVTIDRVAVGDPGNACDAHPHGCFGAVATTYRISKHEVTNTQYAEFLNAADPDGTNPNGIYNSNMTSNSFGGIDFSAGAAAGTKYAAKAGRGDMPVNYVSWYDSLRFINWLHNGQGSGDTETGAYTFSGATSVGPREAGASVFLPTEDEWYKAAYFDGTNYFDYPAGSDTKTTCSSPTPTANHANCGHVHGDATDVGSYPGSASPYGTFDQGGNEWEWNETTIGSNRGLRGGYFRFDAHALAAAAGIPIHPLQEGFAVGFRVASVPGLGNACDDGIDNEPVPDGKIDFPADPGCAALFSPTENPACQDGLDDDGDGLIDWDGGASAGVPVGLQTAKDPGCINQATRQSEIDILRPVACGVGAELAFLLPPVMWLRRHRRRRRAR